MQPAGRRLDIPGLMEHLFLSLNKLLRLSAFSQWRIGNKFNKHFISSLYLSFWLAEKCWRRYTKGKQLPWYASGNANKLLTGRNFLVAFFSCIEVWLKFRTACQDHQAGKTAVKCLSHGHNREARAGFESRYVDYHHDTLITRAHCRRQTNSEVSHPTESPQWSHLIVVEKFNYWVFI